MALTDQDRDSIELIATRIGEKFAEASASAMAQMLEHHQDACPHGRRLLESKWFLAGAAGVGLFVAGGGSALGSVLIKLLTGT